MRTVAGSEVRFVEHGTGVPSWCCTVPGVDHREAEACFEPALERTGLRRVHPDLPGTGRSPADRSISSAADVVAVLTGFIAAIAREPVLLVGHSAGGYLAQALTSRTAGRSPGRRSCARCSLPPGTSGTFGGPVLVVTGRQDSIAGSAAAVDLQQYPHAALAVLDRAGHALPHEQPAVLSALLADRLERVVDV